MKFRFKHGYGPPPPFGHGWHPGFGPGFRRGGSRGRGEMKYEILEVLAEGPRHGYDIMIEIEHRRGLRPSPGSIYPALQMLEDGDFVTSEEREGKRTYSITGKGRELLAKRAEEEGPDTGENFYAIIAEAMRQVHGIKDAARQIAKTGNPELYKKAVAVLDKARRDLFDILADQL
jgi:DNA-binding PadR family transcriptional regulator